jgi:hypothetical protein
LKKLNDKFGVSKLEGFQHLKPRGVTVVPTVAEAYSRLPLVIKDDKLLQTVKKLTESRKTAWKECTRMNPETLAVYYARAIKAHPDKIFALPKEITAAYILRSHAVTEEIRYIESLRFESRLLPEWACLEHFCNPNTELSEKINWRLKGFACSYDDYASSVMVQTYRKHIDIEFYVNYANELIQLAKVCLNPTALLIDTLDRQGLLITGINLPNQLDLFQSPVRALGAVRVPVPVLLDGCEYVFDFAEVMKTLKFYSDLNYKPEWSVIFVALYMKHSGIAQAEDIIRGVGDDPVVVKNCNDLMGETQEMKEFVQRVSLVHEMEDEEVSIMGDYSSPEYLEFLRIIKDSQEQPKQVESETFVSLFDQMAELAAEEEVGTPSYDSDADVSYESYDSDGNRKPKLTKPWEVQYSTEEDSDKVEEEDFQFSPMDRLATQGELLDEDLPDFSIEEEGKFDNG